MSDYQKNASQVQLLLLKVCHSWADIALRTPSLGEAQYLDGPFADISCTVSTERFVEILSDRFDRARGHPISISLTGALNHPILHPTCAPAADVTVAATDGVLLWDELEVWRGRISSHFAVRDAPLRM
jgi:hypothetical protein